MGEILACQLKSFERVLALGRAVDALCIPQVYDVVSRLVGDHLFVAVTGLAIILLRAVDVSQSLPGFSIVLRLLQVLIQDSDRLVLHVHVSKQTCKSLHSLRVAGVLLEQIKQNFLCLDQLTHRLVILGQHAHAFNRLGELGARHLQEELGPFELAESQSGVEEFLNQVHVCRMRVFALT